MKLTLQLKLNSTQITTLLRERIKGCRVGTQIPPELELAAEFGVARATMNKIIMTLVREGIIQRHKFSGTFVTEPPAVKKVITFLIPCADFFYPNKYFESAAVTHWLLSGMLRCAYEHQAKVETIAVSPSNRREDIDWKSLDHLDSSSLVFVDSFWYLPLFPFLLERGCRVVLNDPLTVWHKSNQKYLQYWRTMAFDRVNALAALYGAMVRRGCKRIGLFARSLNEPEHPTLAGFQRGAAENGGDPKLYHSLPIFPDQDMSPAEKLQCFRDFQKKHMLDGILFSHRLLQIPVLNGLHRVLELPENVQFGIIEGCVHEIVPGADCLLSAFDVEAFGYRAGKKLLAAEFHPDEEIFHAEIF